MARRGRAPGGAGLLRTILRLRHWGGRSQVAIGSMFVLCSVGISVGIVVNPLWVPPSAFLLLELVAVFLLRLRSLVALLVAILVQVAALYGAGQASVSPGVVVVVTLSVVAIFTFARERERLGLLGAPGDLMLVDLKDRLAAHGRVPALPAGWRVDSEIRSAYADAFSGDFMVAGVRDGSELEIALVDVSGKGQEAGVRSLQLSGAFGGWLLLALPSELFLPAANRYLLDQDWEEGFATAVHVTVNLTTGAYRASSAGHPPPMHLHVGSGRLDVVDTVGSPALGIVDDLTFASVHGHLEPGDALLLYTDGLVDAPDTDLTRGIDRLMGVADGVLSTRRGGAAAVLSGVRAADSDDRAVVLVRRD